MIDSCGGYFRNGLHSCNHRRPFITDAIVLVSVVFVVRVPSNLLRFIGVENVM